VEEMRTTGGIAKSSCASLNERKEYPSGDDRRVPRGVMKIGVYAISSFI
jgi:hypothetical protein